MTSPFTISDESFGKCIKIANNIAMISATGTNGLNGKVYRYNYEYDTIVTHTQIKNLNITDPTIIQLDSVANITTGMLLSGYAFTDNQVVVAIYPTINQIKLSAEPNGIYYGNIEFKLKKWVYDSYLSVPSSSNDYYGHNIELSKDASTLIVVSQPSLSNNKLYIYSRQNTDEYVLVQVIYGISNEYGSSLTISDDSNYIAVGDPSFSYINTNQGKVDLYKLITVRLLYDNTIINWNTTTLTLPSTEGIIPGMFISGYGFNSGQYIVEVVNSTTVILNVAPDTKPSGYITITGYTLYQEIIKHNSKENEKFGDFVKFFNNLNSLAILNKSSKFSIETTFDNATTTFDGNSINFIKTYDNVGVVDIYDQYNNIWVYSESLKNFDNNNNDIVTTIDASNNVIFVGKPKALTSLRNNNGYIETGKLFLYTKIGDIRSWSIITSSDDIPDASKIKRAYLYNKNTDEIVSSLDIIDVSKGIIPKIADVDIDFKTFYDPAVYSFGTDYVTVNDTLAWTNKYIGKVWWDLSTCKLLNNHDTDIVYKHNVWYELFPGASVDIYEWVETTYLPSEWDSIADTYEGLSNNISGTSLYGDDVYSIAKTYDKLTKTFKTFYYFWVKNKTIIPNINNRSISAKDISILISDPRSTGYKFLTITGSNSFLISNVKDVITNNDIILSIEYWLTDATDKNVHTQWKLISENQHNTIPFWIEDRWIDSLCGKDEFDRPLPNYKLPIKLRYGLDARLRKSMFINRFEALKQSFEYINSVLKNTLIVGQYDLTKLNYYDNAPLLSSGLFDVDINVYEDLQYVSVNKFRMPVLTPVIENGRLVDVLIDNGGFNYKVPPTAIVSGKGIGAEIKTNIDSSGRITSCDIISSGEGYLDNTTIVVRSFSVLIYIDENANNNWSIYEYNVIKNNWTKRLTKSYDTRDYWYYIDWYKTGYNEFISQNHIINTLYDLNSINVLVGEVVKVKNAFDGKWVLLIKYNNEYNYDWTKQYEVIGVEQATIQFDRSLYDISVGKGFDASLFDIYGFDYHAYIELRNILIAIKNDIFIGELRTNYIRLFFISLRYILNEQKSVDWLMKTSFMTANHNVGKLEQYTSYRNNNLDDFIDFIDEVKPYRSKIRKYVSNYIVDDALDTSLLDYDLFSYVDNNEIKHVETSIDNGNLIFSEISDKELQQYWINNVGYSVVEIKVIDGGEGYTSVPDVIIDDPQLLFNSTEILNYGSTATARAVLNTKEVIVYEFSYEKYKLSSYDSAPYDKTNYDFNNAPKDGYEGDYYEVLPYDFYTVITKTVTYVDKIIVTYPGSGYVTIPNVTLSGGLAIGGKTAKAIACLGDSLTRRNLTTIKFDRINDSYLIMDLSAIDTFSGTGSKVEFELSWPPDKNRNTSAVTINDISIYDDEYTLSSTSIIENGYLKYIGFITFTTPPVSDAIINVTYLKNVEILNATDRIQYFYNPKHGDIGKDLSQLMKGINYPSYNIDGMDLISQHGWSSAPYFSSAWDSYDETFDDYTYSANETTTSIELPYIPEENTQITVYISRAVKVKFNGQVTRWSNIVSNIDSTRHLKIGESISGFGIPENTLIASIDTLHQITMTKKATRSLENSEIISIIGYSTPVRLDDVNYGTGDDLINVNAIMPTWIGDGINNVIDLPISSDNFDESLFDSGYFNIHSRFAVQNGDKFILRKITSDGTMISTNFDTIFDGSSDDDSVIFNGAYDQPDIIAAPEEVVPGNVIDTLAVLVKTENSTMMQFKDMFGKNHYKNFNVFTTLASEVLADSETIELTDASLFDSPNIISNNPGVIYVNGERIEYFIKTGNILSQLRRATMGTGLLDTHSVGSTVYNMGNTASLLYNDIISKVQVVSDGSPIIKLPYIPVKDHRFEYTDKHFISSIPYNTYGQCNEIEVYVGGYFDNTEWEAGIQYNINDLVKYGAYVYKCIVSHVSSVKFSTDLLYWEIFIGDIKLKKSPFIVHDINKSLNSPEGDTQLDAQFYVDGNTPYVTLTTSVPVGVIVTVVNVIGKVEIGTV